MIYKRVDKYLKESWIGNIENIFFLQLILIWCRQATGGRYDVEDDEVEWDIIYDWVEEAVPV